MRATNDNPFGVPVLARLVAGSIQVSVNNRAYIAAATPAAAGFETFDVAMEPDGTVLLTYAVTAAAPVQRVSTDGGRTWATR